MSIVYKDFAVGLANLNRIAFEPNSTLVDGARSYRVNGKPLRFFGHNRG